eukprot:583083-Rhodomonas_salina.3
MGRIFALKVAKNDYGWQQSAIRAEAAILAQLHHPNLVALHGLVTDQTQLEFGDVGIMTTLCPQGSLDVLLSVVGKLDEEIVRLFTKDIVAAVAYLHRCVMNPVQHTLPRPSRPVCMHALACLHSTRSNRLKQQLNHARSCVCGADRLSVSFWLSSRHGVVHRDIKPANCFLKDGQHSSQSALNLD